MPIKTKPNIKSTNIGKKAKHKRNQQFILQQKHNICIMFVEDLKGEIT